MPKVVSEREKREMGEGGEIEREGARVCVCVDVCMYVCVLGTEWKTLSKIYRKSANIIAYIL